MTEALSVLVESDALPTGASRTLSLSWRSELGLVDEGRVELEVDELDYDGTRLLGADVVVTLARPGIGERRFALEVERPSVGAVRGGVGGVGPLGDVHLGVREEGTAIL